MVVGSDKVSSISLFCNDLGHTILRIPIASLLFDASNIRLSGAPTIKANVAESVNQPLKIPGHGLDKNTSCGIFLEQSDNMLFHVSCFL